MWDHVHWIALKFLMILVYKTFTVARFSVFGSKTEFLQKFDSGGLYITYKAGQKLTFFKVHYSKLASFKSRLQN